MTEPLRQGRRVGGSREGPRNRRKETTLALGIVQAGYKSSLCWYTAGVRFESQCSYEEWLAELTTELELALEKGTEEDVKDSENGADSSEENQTAESYSSRKKEWAELLEQSVNLEGMLRQMLENGLGQQKEEQQTQPKKQEKGELDNEFHLEGIPAATEGTSRSSTMPAGLQGNSQFLQTDTAHGAEYFNLANGGRQYCEGTHAICLTCETECNRKKQWKII